MRRRRLMQVLPGRAVTWVSAILLPHLDLTTVDWALLDAHISRIHEAGLTTAVKMDTGCVQVLDLLAGLGVGLVCSTAGSPSHVPHIRRPAYFPPSDGYQPPEDPLAGGSADRCHRGDNPPSPEHGGGRRRPVVPPGMAAPR